MRDPLHKIATLDVAVAWRQTLRAAGGTLCATNGCFDLLHRGHCEGLYRASREADVLVVLLNSDASVRQLKGPGRPVHGEQDRAYVLASLAAVSLVVVFDGPNCATALAALEPDVYAKSEEYHGRQDAAEAAAIAACGARTVWLPRLAGLSSTAAIAALAQGRAA